MEFEDIKRYTLPVVIAVLLIVIVVIVYLTKKPAVYVGDIHDEYAEEQDHAKGSSARERKEWGNGNTSASSVNSKKDTKERTYDFSVPSYSGNLYEAVNGNIPSFTEDDFKKAEKSFMKAESTDGYGRAVMAAASIGSSSLSKSASKSSESNPSGWRSLFLPGVTDNGVYDTSVSQNLYNKAQLISNRIGGNNGSGNMITATRYMTASGLYLFEQKISQYIRSSGDRVLYRATPVFVGSESLCRGVLLEAASVKDRGASLSFSVYLFNVQPGFDISYKDGKASANGGK